jgi:predicted nucleotidyltransferase
LRPSQFHWIDERYLRDLFISVNTSGAACNSEESQTNRGGIDQVLEPYLQVLRDEFSPDRVVLFGSHAYGEPNADSDVDLLVVKPMTGPAWREAFAIRKAWRIVRRTHTSLPIDLILETPENHVRRCVEGGGFYDEINRLGRRLL